MENPKVETKVHDPPNLIPGIDVRWFAKKNGKFRPKKKRSMAILLFDPTRPPLGNQSGPKWVLELYFAIFWGV